MHTIINQRALLQLATTAKNIAPRNSPKPILTHLLLEADSEGGLQISATDDEQAFVGVAEKAGVEKPGRITVSARDLHDVVRKMPDHPIELIWDAKEKLLELRSDRISFHLQTLPAEEYPSLPVVEPENMFALPAFELVRLIERTIFAVSQEATRYYLCGAFMECPGEGAPIRFTATDGHRLSLAEIPAPPGFRLASGYIIPHKFLVGLHKALSSHKGEVLIGFQKRRILFQYGSQTLMGLLVDGSFPDYSQVIPKDPPIVCQANRLELLNALQRISVMSPDKTGGVRFTLEDNALILSSQHTGRGRGKQEVEVQGTDGALEAGFNARYFIDALQVIDTPEVSLGFTNHLSPCLIQPVPPEAEDDTTPPRKQINVAMPMRI